MRLTVFLILAGTLASCATVSPQAAKVRIVNSERPLANCRFIDSVRGDQNLYGGALFARAAYDDALNQMKAATAKAGGNTLFVRNADTGFLGANAMGDAYAC